MSKIREIVLACKLVKAYSYQLSSRQAQDFTMTKKLLESIWFKQSLPPEVQSVLLGCSVSADESSKELTLTTDNPKAITRNFNILDSELRSLGFKKVYIFKGEDFYCSTSLGIFQDTNAGVPA